ncbi:IMP dehydrogenase [Caldivirga maquilingensis]|nr:IMP dehydrogenase [Caldivirga maquilingensis]
MFREKIPIKGLAVTFNDVVLLPGKATLDPISIDTSTKVSRSVSINIPLVSSPMDTVTEDALAIALARLGGVGVIHRNMTINDEVNAVKAVKDASPYPVIPFSLNPLMSSEEAMAELRRLNLDTLPIVDEGRVIGYIRRSRLLTGGRLIELAEKPVMAPVGSSGDELVKIMRENGTDTVALVDKDNVFIGIASYYDLNYKPPFKPATDGEGRLIVGAAVSPFDVERAVKVSKYADFLVVDVAHVDNENALTALAKLVKETPVDVIVGNLGTYDGAVDAITRVDPIGGFRVGIASGSICSTGVVTGVAAPTLWAVAQVADAALDYGLGSTPIIADGGIREPGDVVKAMAAGAWAAMMGRVFAQATESPSPIIRVGNRLYKYYRGMASEGARARRFAMDRYAPKVKNIEEGVEGLVPYRGDLANIVREFVGGIQAALGYIGASNTAEARVKGRFMIVTESGRGEVEPHDLVLNI